MNLFDFSLLHPPSDQQFEEISEILLSDLCKRTQIAFEATGTYVETNNWVTTRIRSQSLLKDTIDLVLIGMIGYAFRDGLPKIDSVLLAFSRGKRLSIGRDTILTASYTKGMQGGEWSEYCWSDDVYHEWECDELPSNS